MWVFLRIALNGSKIYMHMRVWGVHARVHIYMFIVCMSVCMYVCVEVDTVDHNYHQRM